MKKYFSSRSFLTIWIMSLESQKIIWITLRRVQRKIQTVFGKLFRDFFMIFECFGSSVLTSPSDPNCQNFINVQKNSKQSSKNVRNIFSKTSFSSKNKYFLLRFFLAIWKIPLLSRKIIWSIIGDPQPLHPASPEIFVVFFFKIATNHPRILLTQHNHLIFFREINKI